MERGLLRHRDGHHQAALGRGLRLKPAQANVQGEDEVSGVGKRNVYFYTNGALLSLGLGNYNSNISGYLIFVIRLVLIDNPLLIAH